MCHALIQNRLESEGLNHRHAVYLFDGDNKDGDHTQAYLFSG